MPNDLLCLTSTKDTKIEFIHVNGMAMPLTMLLTVLLTILSRYFGSVHGGKLVLVQFMCIGSFFNQELQEQRLILETREDRESWLGS
jgi:hypothetical protein